MPFGSHTNKNRLLALTLILMVPFSVAFADDDSQIVAVKDEFSQLWHAAAETTKKRATLEQILAQFDGKVASARKDLEAASAQRKMIREHIIERRAYVEALQGQVQAAQETKEFYETIALGQRDDFVRFIQYMTSTDIALQESGPAAGGQLLKVVLRGSLGDSIDTALAYDAVIKARTQFLAQVRVLVSESDRVQARLKEVADDYAGELKLLEDEHRAAASVVDEKTQFIDDSWKQKRLTEEELRYVAKETAEANSRIAAMQESLVQINEDLRQAKLKKFAEKLAPVEQQKKDLEHEREAVMRKDTAMSLLEEAAVKAYQQAILGKNTDKKLYKKIEQLKLNREHAADDLAGMKSRQTESGSNVLPRDMAAVEAMIMFMDETLALMKDGVPQDLAETYVTAKKNAAAASIERKQLALKIAGYAPQFAEIEKHIVAITAESEAAAKQFELGGDLPPMFLWPVSGRITAGYFDVEYESVFGVPHRAVDIAVPQATPVRAIADGVVFAFKDGGLTGFSYILIGHRNGYASLYGHVSSSFVKQGDIVSVGQMIGLSGGKRGAHGSGPMTTGPHLHLEITKSGVHVNPASVLPPR